MTNVEKDRLCEVLFYKYFENQSEETLGDAKFWNCISAICQAFDVDSLLVSKTVRILMAEENRPDDFETWYLFYNLGVSVRQMNRFTGIYWQKQKKFEQTYNDGTVPAIRKRITDVAMQHCMRAFITAIHSLYGSFKFLPTNVLDDVDKASVP